MAENEFEYEHLDDLISDDFDDFDPDILDIGFHLVEPSAEFSFTEDEYA